MHGDLTQKAIEMLEKQFGEDVMRFNDYNGGSLVEAFLVGYNHARRENAIDEVADTL